MSTEVQQVRQQEIKLIKVDCPETNIRFTGRSSSMRASETDPVWQILLEYNDGSVYTSNYALMGEFKCRWDLRTSYFAAVTPIPNQPLCCPDQVQLTGSITGEFRPAGLQNGGRITEVTIDDTQWWPLPPTPLSQRNAISIQNQNTDGSMICKLNYDPLAPYRGTIVYAGGERFYQITDSIIMYARAAPGKTFVLTIEEIS